jgi:hypothetical protein
LRAAGRIDATGAGGAAAAAPPGMTSLTPQTEHFARRPAASSGATRTFPQEHFTLMAIENPLPTVLRLAEMCGDYTGPIESLNPTP